ncbi:MAG: lipoate--protein ligase family protein [Gemmatimonadetes bacterium]|nr:lipoate--protein ligase family protein [Gemmatimonadota bacterium]
MHGADTRRERRFLSAGWRLLETGARPGAWNMTCDRAVLSAVEDGGTPPTLRFYGWSPPAVSIGRHQPNPEPEAIRTLDVRGVDCVRRPTGGRAVYHGPIAEELTYSVVAPIGVPPFAGRGADAYRRIHSALAAALVELGVGATLASDGAGRRLRALRPDDRLACFASPVGDEVTVDGKKLVGSAQRRTRRAFLQHGSIPLAGDHRLLNVVWPGSLDPGAATTVSAAAVRTVSYSEMAGCVARAFERTLNVRLSPGVLTPEEAATIDATCGALATT